ncbi:MAG TPA: stage II sporulation protein M [Anaerolineales bacterium]|nr:stage II sporulation protein M [Anaerolineales bacterium]
MFISKPWQKRREWPMQRDLDAIWLVARREFLDQFRDWRIVVPMILLVTIFPFIADDTTRQAVNFMNRYGGDLILDRLIPFVVLVIGFFPLSFTLVVALESFVGEKERGTIEPLLSSPLEDRHLYLGKLLVGITTPLAFSFLSIGLYLILVSRRAVEFPSAYMLALILFLTVAHAVLMVSSAIVISVQATSIRAANLLASFVVVPVAFLIQGETVLIFWGNEEVLWLAILGVALLAGLLVRLGLSHFKREYLLGREIDSLNLKWMWNIFRGRFTSGAVSVGEWYRKVLPDALRQLKTSVGIVLIVGVISLFVGYLWITEMISASGKLTPDNVEEMRTFISNNLDSLDSLSQHFSPPRLFFHNVRTTLVILLTGIFSFATFGLALFVVNLGFVGIVLGAADLIGYSPFFTFMVGILPHGIFELPAVVLATAAMLRMGALLVTPQTDKSLGEVFLLSLADWSRIFVGLVLPLLAVASVVEVYITPALIKLAFPFL